MNCINCGSSKLVLIQTITKKPDVEVDYNIPAEKYSREIYQCDNCGAYNNIHDLLGEDMYSGDYNSAIEDGVLLNRFNRIINLPPENSDNVNRSNRVAAYCEKNIPSNGPLRLLDIGSGTCVFPYEMKKRGFKVTCIDPDQHSMELAKNTVGVEATHCGDIFTFDSDKKYDVITFNKVLEHLKEPIIHLKEARKYLAPNGFLYVELPEGDRIKNENRIDQRAEFAVEHYSIYNKQAIESLLNLAGFDVAETQVITDPSGKYTIYSFAKHS